MLTTKQERIEYYTKSLEAAKNSYSYCKGYFKDKNMPDEDSDKEPYCGYFKNMIEYWRNKLEEEQSQ